MRIFCAYVKQIKTLSCMGYGWWWCSLQLCLEFTLYALAALLPYAVGVGLIRCYKIRYVG